MRPGRYAAEWGTFGLKTHAGTIPGDPMSQQ